MNRRFLDTFGKRAYALRKDLGFETQGDFLEALEKKTDVSVSQSHWSGIENSDRIPSGRIVAAVADLLGTTADFLLLRSDDPFPPGDEVKPAYITPEAERIALIVDEIRSERRRQEAMRMVDALLTEDQRAQIAEALASDSAAFRRLIEKLQERMEPEEFEEFINELRSDLGLDPGESSASTGTGKA